MSLSEATTLERSLTELYDREKALEKALNDCAEIEGEYKLKLAKEYRLAEGSIQARENAALEACAKEYIDYLRADAVKAIYP